MGSTEPRALEILPIGLEHVQDGLALSTEAGWNQVEADWKMMVRHGAGFGFADDDGRLIGSGFAVPYPPSFGWVSLVLVTGAWRRRGLATRILRHLINWLAERRLTAVLDATPAGATLYEPIGFRPVATLERWRGAGAAESSTGGSASADDVERIVAIDAEAFGAPRRDILGDILARNDTAFHVDDSRQSFVLARRGRSAIQVGPLVARGPTIASRLLDHTLLSLSGPAVLDIPTSSKQIARTLVERGFEVERPFIRMVLGQDRPFGARELIWATAGPELG